MPVFKVDIEKKMGSEYWTNVWHVLTADLATARVQGEALAEAERSLHYSPVTFTKMRVSDIVIGTEVFVTIPLGYAGLLTTDSDYLPLFNVLRVDLTPSEGRSGRKYYRMPIPEGITSGGLISTVETGARQTHILDNIITPLDVCDADGNAFVDAAVQREIGMRQLRRGSRRRTEPVLP